MSATTETYPDLRPESTRGTRTELHLGYYFAGPSFQNPNRVNSIADPNLRNRQLPFFPPPIPPPTPFPPSTTISLEPLVQGNFGLLGHIENPITVHYRFLSPDDLQIIMDHDRTVIINPAAALTATLTKPANPPQVELPLFGDVKVKVSNGMSHARALSNILDKITVRIGLTRDVVKYGRFMWALRAECSLLSERIDAVSWDWLRRSLGSGGWWIRVYIAEIEPQPGTGWVTKAPAFAPAPQ